MIKSQEKKIDQFLLDALSSLNGKITKTQFKKITQHYQWKFNFKSIHIVGTNGKGSNAKYINDELIKQGYRVGLFTSPHLISMYERIKINNQEIDFEKMTKFISRLKADFIDINFGWFDVFFLLALAWFNDVQLDYAIFEAGIGAKKDVVNYLNHHYLLITSISYDHQNILGKTLEAIANDKAAAIKNNVEVFVSDAIDNHLINIFQKKAKEKKCILNVVETNHLTYESINISLSKYVLRKAIGIKEFKSRFILPPGRSQKIEINNLDHYLDVAHNEEAIKKAIEYYQINNIELSQVVLSLSQDKEQEKIVNFLKEKFKIIYVYQNKGRKPFKLYDYQEDLPKILNLKFFLMKLDTKTLFIGSFYFISEILEEIKEVKSQQQK